MYKNEALIEKSASLLFTTTGKNLGF